jgi:hypothetical protein
MKNKNENHNIARFGSMLPRLRAECRRKTLLSAKALGVWLLFVAAVSETQAQTCVRCPPEATGVAIAANGPGIFAMRNGVRVSVGGSMVGACDQLLIIANVSYSPFGIGGEIGAGFTGGAGYIILPNGTAVDVTPPDMATTIVGPCIGSAPVKQMIVLPYTLTSEDIANGSARFIFAYTNGTYLLPNDQGICDRKLSFALETSVAITPPPTGHVNVLSNSAAAESPSSLGVSATGTGPLTYSWSGPNGFISTNMTIPTNEGEVLNAGKYTATITDMFGCSVTCFCLLPSNPRITNYSVIGSDFILSGSGGAANGAYIVLTATNAAAPVSCWFPILTNYFGADGAFTVTNLINRNESQRYFRVQVPRE